MKIAIIGAGKVGSALGVQLSKVGQDVIYGVKESEKMGANFFSNLEAIRRSEVILLTVPWKASIEVVSSVKDWNGKILVDCTNPINADFTGLELGQTTSGAEEIQKIAVNAKVVKCFNQTGFENMADPKFEGGAPIMFAAGNDANATDVVATLAQSIGFQAIKLPMLSLARQLEQLAWLWIYTAYKTNTGRNFAFGLLQR